MTMRWRPTATGVRFVLERGGGGAGGSARETGWISLGVSASGGMVPARVLVAYWGGERAGEGIKEYTLDGYSSDGVILVEGGFVGGANTSGGANPTSGGANPSDGLSATLDRVDGIRRLTLHLPSSAGACSAEGFPAALALCEGAPTPMIAAIGVGAPWKSYHTERASLAIAGGGERVQAVKIPLSKLIVAHAALMLGAWLLLAPLGVGIARYLRPPRHAALSGGAAAGGWRFWFVAHRALQVLAALCTFAGVALAFAGTRRTHHYDHAHGRAGLGLLLLVLFQTLNGVFRPQKNKPSPPPKPEPVQLPMMSSRSSSARSRSSLASFAIFAHMSHFPWHTLHLAHVFTPDSLSLSLSHDQGHVADQRTDFAAILRGQGVERRERINPRRAAPALAA